MADHTYETIVLSTPEQVWNALTDGELTQQYYFGTRVESDWTKGSPVRYYGYDGQIALDGEILEIEPAQRLVTTFVPNWVPGAGSSQLSWEIQSLGPVSHIKLVHSGIDDATFEAGQMHLGWVFGLASLKSLLENGQALPNIFGG
ncbi:MAG: SRPBCC domain-containing protein [Roseiflexaceae bacterium]